MLLLEGVNSHYPSVDFNEVIDADRFIIERMTSDRNSDSVDIIPKYLIKDRLLELEVPINKNHLMDLEFNLVEWYRDFLDETGICANYYNEEVLEIAKGLQHYRTENREDPIVMNEPDPGETSDADSEDFLPGLVMCTAQLCHRPVTSHGKP
jgi:hypothetical protein